MNKISSPHNCILKVYYDFALHCVCVLLVAVYRVMDTKDKLSILKEVDIHSSSSGKVKDIIMVMEWADRFREVCMLKSKVMLKCMYGVV